MLNYFPAKKVHLWGCSSAGRAQGWQSWGQGFDPPQLHQNKQRPVIKMTGLFYFHEGDRTQGSLRERISLMLWGSTREGWPSREAKRERFPLSSTKINKGRS